MTTYWIFFGIGMIILGMFLAFFGNKFVNAVIFCISTLAIFVLVGNLFFELFMKKVSKEWVQWVIIVLIFIAGMIIGYILVKMRKYGIAVLAAWGGAMLGVFIATFSFSAKGAVYWILIVALAIVFGALAFFLEKFVIQLMTSFIGSYLMIRGISLFAGGFPNEIELHEQIESGALDWSTLDKAIYAYLSGIVMMTALAFYFQRKHDVEQKPKYAL